MTTITTYKDFLIGWPYRKAIVVKPDHVTETLYNFPLCVKLNDPDVLMSVQADGADLRFTSSDGLTLLAHELDGFSVTGSTASGNIWVCLPELSGNDTLYMYWGNENAIDGQMPTGVWNNNFVCVYHMSSDLLDSTRNNLDLTNSNTSETLGIINQARMCGVSKYMSTSHNDILNITDKLTMDAVVWLDSSTSLQSIIRKGNTGIAARIDGDMKLLFYGYINGVLQSNRLSNVLTSGNWHHLCITYDNDASALMGYVDGELTSGVVLNGLLSTSTNDLNFCNTLWGNIDEARISNVAASSGWIHFEYNNIFSSDGEIIFGPSEQPYALPLFLKCEWTQTSGILDTYVQGHDLVEQSLDFYLLNIGLGSGNIDFFTHGYLENSGTLNLFLMANISSGDLSLYTLGHELASGDLQLYTLAHTCVTSGVDLFIHGLDTGSGLLDLHTWGHKTASGLIDFYTIGHQDYSVAVPLFLKSDIPALGATLPLFVGNYNTTLEDYLELYINGDGANEGFSTYSKSVPLIIGRNEAIMNTIPMYIKCFEDSPSGFLDMYICGAYLANSGLDLVTKGCDTLTGQLSLYTHGY